MLEAYTDKTKERIQTVIGQRFGKTVVLSHDESKPAGDPYMLIKCDCGSPVKSVRLMDLIRTDRNSIQSCGNCNMYKNVGKTFNHLTILEILPSQKTEDIEKGLPDKTSTFTNTTERAKYQYTRCKVVCECGTSEPFVTYQQDVTSGRKRQCDQFNCTYAKRRTHNGAKANDKANPAYRTWTGMHLRCYDPKHISYANYGALGVKVEWIWNEKNPDGLKNFTDWFIKNKDNPEYTLDRINPYGNYGPENCRFASPSTQSANQRQNNPERYERTYKHTRYTPRSTDFYDAQVEYARLLYRVTKLSNPEDALITAYALTLIHNLHYNVMDVFPYDLAIVPFVDIDKTSAVVIERIMSGRVSNRENKSREIIGHKLVKPHNGPKIGERQIKYLKDEEWKVCPILFPRNLCFAIIDKIVRVRQEAENLS